ncbi:hypothetical protein ACFO8O_13600 [Hephaestia sp. GCM10023244]|uniref:hypothetical protein n=1 Tax=unclassified Hephaestia TaxID=2631281 RepID=UPI0020770C7D|nr:hypothetical protein [Hephaestia sp. MAHUQ-44]MCM8731995.1 hypothetical protein [Hephaestia sp. MAHUQ-44]
MIFPYLADIARSWGQAKLWLSDATGLSPDALHVHVSILAMLTGAVLWRRRMDHPLPWLSVLVLEIANEALDLSTPIGGENSLHASMHDILNTMFLPTVILICLRFTRRWRRV